MIKEFRPFLIKISDEAIWFERAIELINMLRLYEFKSWNDWTKEAIELIGYDDNTYGILRSFRKDTQYSLAFRQKILRYIKAIINDVRIVKYVEMEINYENLNFLANNLNLDDFKFQEKDFMGKLNIDKIVMFIEHLANAKYLQHFTILKDKGLDNNYISSASTIKVALAIDFMDNVEMPSIRDLRLLSTHNLNFIIKRVNQDVEI